MTLEELLKLSGASLADAATALEADPDDREEVDGYEGLTDLDVIEAPGGARIYLRGEDVVMIYVGRRALPEGTDAHAVEAAVGSAGEELRSRQGKRAHIHVVAKQGRRLVRARRHRRVHRVVPADDLQGLPGDDLRRARPLQALTGTDRGCVRS